MLEASSEQTSQEACQDIESMSLGIAIFSEFSFLGSISNFIQFFSFLIVVLFIIVEFYFGKSSGSKVCKSFPDKADSLEANRLD